MKERVHKITVTVRFDKPITRSQAIAEFRDIIHGEFYPGGYSDAETMKIGSVKSGGSTK